MSKKIVILFSGGLDSTYLVWKNLKEGNIVTPVYIEIKNNANKVLLEKNRIKLIHDELDKEFNQSDFVTSNLKPIEYLMDVNLGNTWYSDPLIFKQIPIWIFGLLFIQGIDADEIQIGYVGNDDAVSYIDDIINIYQSYESICNPMIPLKFPLVKHFKSEIMHDLPQQYRDLVVSCENPNIIEKNKQSIKSIEFSDNDFLEYEPCCECASCKKIISTDYYYLNYYPDNYKKNMLNNHIRQVWNSGYKVYDDNGNIIYGLNPEPVKEKNNPIQLTLDFNEIGDVCKAAFATEKYEYKNAINYSNG
jgi:hypothetical protein